MHADNAHQDKPGFFSKIFGHHDPAVPAATGPTAGAVTMPEVPTLTEPTVPPNIAPASDDDATSVPMPQVDPTPPSTEEAVEGTNTPEASDAETLPTDAALGASHMGDVHAVPKGDGEALDLSSLTPSAAPPTEATETATADQSAPDQSTSINIQTNTSDEQIQKEIEPATPIEPEVIDNAPEVSNVPEPAETIDPPAPPVEEGEAWRAAQTVPEPTENQRVTPVEPPTLESAEGNLNSAQDAVNEILESRPDVTTDKPSDTEDTDSGQTEAEQPEASDPKEPDSKAEPVVAQSGPSPETQAAVVRIEKQIAGLEDGLQKLRVELNNLK